nr:UPF0481 protein At3g47200-like [Ipomoea batatas]
MAILRRRNPQILRREKRWQQIQKATRIQKVAHFLRSKNGNNSSDYDPKVVSLGPYHHGKPELQLFQEFKKKTLEMFVSGGDKETNFYHNLVLEVVDYLRSYYLDGSTSEYEDAEFAEMMLLDSCFILNHIMIITRVGDAASRCSITDTHIGFTGLRFIEHDMILLENQIPLRIIELLFNARYGDLTTTLSISAGMGNSADEIYYPWKELLSRYCQECLFGQYFDDYDDKGVEPPHLLEAFRMHLVSDCDQCLSQKVEPSHESFREDHYFSGSVMDLKSKGIHFGCNGKVQSLRGVKVKAYKFYTKLELPIWYASPQSRVLFTNIIAYELCPNSDTKLEMISCVNFMKSLIVSPADAKELREKHIITNALGDDSDVVKFFKGLNTDEFENPYIFREVKRKIGRHCDSKAKTLWAEFLYTYFRRPWTVIALLAATLLLVLTCIQTYFTIHSCQ